MKITHIKTIEDKRMNGPPFLHATFDVELPNVTLRNCKLLEREDGSFFVGLPRSEDENVDIFNRSVRDRICEAALNALDEAGS
ncbi:MAG TPA: hypothetical protein VHC94_18050 [Nitrobacter sp.]|jgi:hypothetical protein|nr:hypothetical protein [Nitrobacter sp.]